MEQWEVKRELKNYKRLAAQCDRLRRGLERKRTEMGQLRAIASNGLPKGNGTADDVERIVEQIDGLMRYYLKRLSECETAQHGILSMIDIVQDADGWSILHMRYIEGKRFEDIAAELHLSDRTMWNYYNAAICKICSELQ